MPERILVIDDDASFQSMLCEALTEKGYDVERAGSAEQGLELAGRGGFDLILLDVQLPGMTGIEAIPLLNDASPKTDIIVMTAYSSKHSALEAIKLGAYDYFTKPFSLKEMEIVIKRALEKRLLQDQIRLFKKKLGEKSPASNIIGDSEPMRRVKELVERVARLETNVLITGETGTGKELIADTIHTLSHRASGPFVKLNCAAIPETLLESELFGHEKGAFTGATGIKRGKFELAAGGTILLDEIGDMPLHLQPKLLRAVEQKQVERLGGAKPIAFDIRVIAATNQILAELVKQKKFRDDLFYRLNVASIHIPPLRERKGDLPLLAEHFIKNVNVKLGTDIARISPRAMEILFAYDWPGNIRQFANVLERAAIFSRGQVITESEIDLGLQEHERPLAPAEIVPASNLPLRESLQEYEKNLITSALKKHHGVQTEAAKQLGITPKNLWNKLKKHAIDPARYARS